MTPPPPAVPALIVGRIELIAPPVANVILLLYTKLLGPVPATPIPTFNVTLAVPAEEPDAVIVTELALAAAPEPS